MNNLNDKQKDLLKSMGKRGVTSFILKFRNAFNSMCYSCRRLAAQNPTRPLDDYCEKCQPKLQKVLSKYKND